MTAVTKPASDALQPQDRLAAAIQELPQAVALFDTADRLVFWNRAYAEICHGLEPLLEPGTPFEALVRARVGASNLAPGETAEQVAERLAFHRDPSGGLESRGPDGRWREIREYVMADGSRMVMVTDIAERKRAEEALRRSEQRLSLHLEQTPIGSIEWDTEFRVIAWNRAAEQIFGWRREEVLGRRSRELIVPPEARDRIGPALDRLQAGQGGTRSVNENITKAGRTIVCDWFNTTLVDAHGEVIGVAALVQDVTQRLAAEAELRRAKEAAEASDRAKSEFLANISHELRTPLNAIIGFSEVIAAGLLGPVGTSRYAEYAQDINRSGRHLLQIINDLLDLSKIEAGRFDLHETKVSVAEVIATALRMVQGRAEQGGLSCRATVRADLPYLNADERALTQILINLLSNAVKFTPAGGAVEVEAWREADGGVTLAVSDSGIGIAPEDIPRAMAPFSQIDGQLNRRHEGTGLGLPLAKKLAELHGGGLELRSIPGKGTTVSVRLPPQRVLLT